jgi:pimeloyl-ACP methyl ester carboxylesterase
MLETDLELGDGRTLHVYDTGGDGLALFWHHGTPNIGAPPRPLFGAAERLGLRWVSHDRPSYGGSTPLPDRTVGSVAGDVVGIADALGIEHFAVMGHSGGGPHALACAALLPDRVLGVVSMAGMAPFGADGLEWFAGMRESGAASLRAAVEGRAAKERHEATAEGDPDVFIARDYDTFAGEWSWVLDVVRPAIAAGRDGLITDDLAYVNPWGFDPERISVPVLIMHGARDQMVPSSHGLWLSKHLPTAELWLLPDDGHISVLKTAEAALEWLVKRIR